MSELIPINELFRRLKKKTECIMYDNSNNNDEVIKHNLNLLIDFCDDRLLKKQC